MKFKLESMRNEFWMLHPRLRKILCDLDDFCINEFCIEITITSLIRKDNAKSVHCYGRGSDVRSWDFSKEQIDAILEYINRLYPYGDGVHKTIMYHQVGDDSFHFHLQVREVMHG